MRKAIIIVIDGCRPDALREANTPNIDSLWKNGSYSWRAQTVYPCVSLPSHCSLFWGADPEIHGIKSNKWPNDYIYKVPTLFDLCKKKGLKTAMVYGWKPFTPIAKEGTVDILDMNPDYLSDDLKTAKSCVRVIEEENPDFAFYHFNKVDEGPWMSSKQIKAIEDCDNAIGLVLDALKKVHSFNETMIVILADHGGHDNRHGDNIPEDMTILWICFGPGIKRGYEIKKEIVIYDTTSTVAYGLGLEIPSSWTGKPIKEIFL